MLPTVPGTNPSLSFPDLRPLQVVNLVPDAVGRCRDQGEEVEPFGETIARGGPGDRGGREPEPLEEAPLQRERVGTEGGETADAARELPDANARADLIEALAVALDLIEPPGGLEPEGDRKAGLTVGAAAHRRIPIAAGEIAQHRCNACELVFKDVPHLDQNPSRMRVRDVLHCRPVTKPFSAVGWAAALERANKT